MKKEIIEKQLKSWFSQMLQKYTWLNIKYEYSDVEECFLVSFSPSALTKVSEEFSADALDFENKMNRDYPLAAPLFCDEEDLFELSQNAKLLANHPINTFTSEFSPKMAQFNLKKTPVSQSMNVEDNSDEFCYCNHKYDMAA